MTLRTYDVAQRSDEWYALRLGMVTASTVGALLTPTGKVADNDTSRKLALTLAAERITGYAEPSRLSADMWRGIDEEPLARDAYSEHRSPVTECGFMVRDDWGFRIGYSPDGLVGDLGLIEVKSRLHHIHMATILSEQPAPTTAWTQLQCALLVSGRSWIDYVSYSSGMALWTQRVHADDGWQAAIVTAVRACEERITRIIRDYADRTHGLPVMGCTPDYSDIRIEA